MSKISTHLWRSGPKLICFDQIQKNITTRFNGRMSINLSFQNPKILRTISFGHDVIYTLDSLQQSSSHISCLRVYYNCWWLSYPFCAGVKVHHLTRDTPPQTTGLISASPESQPSSSDAKTQLTDFSQIPQTPPRTACKLPVHDIIHIAPVTFPLWDFYFDISEWYILPARAWTPVLMLHLTNPCAKRKVLSPTKSKGKIYKMKSLGHYITDGLQQKKKTGFH